jgi:transglutaminase-like putative cysteine protease
VRRTAALGALAALVLAWSWLRLEQDALLREVFAWAVLVGVMPALLPTRRLRLAAVAVAALVGMRYAFGTWRPGAAWDRFVDGFYLYYDVALPFVRPAQPLMHALVVLAVLGFTLAVALAVAERRALLAAGLLVGGAAWPATLLTSSNTFGRGAVILAAALTVIAALSGAARVRQAGLAGAVVVFAAVGLASIPAVAKGAFLRWETWEPGSRSDVPTNVGYVWNSSYTPITWPAKKTTVLTIEAPPISRYWRATTLDTFNGDTWLESRLPVQAGPQTDPLLPAAARREDRQLRARVTVEALEDAHLIGATVPVRYDVDDLGLILYQETGTAFVNGYVPQGASYTAWSYAPRPAPRALARSRPIYPARLDRHLIVQTRYATPPAPPFGSRDRRREMELIFQENPRLEEYRPLYERALEVAGGAPSPYAATVALETYFRDGPTFTYDEDPRLRGGLPPLVEFLTRTRRGHCQFYAGAMTLMLRYLGIPARIGAGFVSGSYSQEDGRWTVTDRDAHTWVEVWFRGYGWLPFDPTPGRGELDGAYTAASVGFNPAAVAAAVAALGGGGASAFNLDRGDSSLRGGRDVPGDVPGGGTGGAEDSLLRLLAFVAFALATGIALLKLGLRRARYLTQDPRRVAAACRRELSDFLADQRLDVPASATVAELGELLRAEAGVDAERFVDAVEAARYGPPDGAGEAARRARRELRRLERALRRQLSTWERARGVLSLRSLGLT